MDDHQPLLDRYADAESSSLSCCYWKNRIADEPTSILTQQINDGKD